MPLTDNHCETLRDAILNVYPYENKAALESLLIEKINVKLEFTVSYSYPISANDLNKTIQKDNKKRKEKIKILFFQTNAEKLDLNQEFKEIESAIQRAKNRSCKPQFKYVTSTDDIRRAITDENPQIVHFCGHGFVDGHLKLVEEASVSPEFLKSIVGGREDIIKCVLLNACNSAKATVAISHDIDYAIGMNGEIIDEVAIEFAKGFYDGLGSKNNNEDIFLTAFNEGLRAIIAKNYSQRSIPILTKRIPYEDAILNLIKNRNNENKIDEFIVNLKSLPNLSNDKLFTKFYVDYSYPIKKDDLNQLVEIIRQIKDFNLVKSSYRNTLPQYSTIDNTELNNPADVDYIIDILHTKYPFVSDKVPRILQFATNLAGQFEEDSKEYKTITSWVEEVLLKLNISISVKPKVERPSTTSQKSFLFIIISPEDNKFRLEAEFILDENQQSKPQFFDFKETLKTQMQLNSDDEADNGKGVRCNSDEEIPSMIEGIISTFMSQFKEQISKPIIEIFLPYKYLGRNLDDEWRIKDDFNTKIAIVQEYQIILHPLERFTGSQSYKNFQDSWSEFKQFLENESNTSLILEDVEKIHKIDKNYRKIGTSLKKKKCVKLTSPLSPLPQTEQENFWRGVLIGGTPLVFWIHTDKQINLNDTDTYLKKEYLNNNFQNLIDEMCKIRQDAYDDEDNKENKLGYHIGFLCDNPNRIPNIKPLTSF